jgi:CRP-like cAMP-binding protein
MLEEILKNTQINQYITPYEDGKTIFLEGDASQDLYILVSGQLNVFKGNKKIAQITEKGSLFGEMSFLLDARKQKKMSRPFKSPKKTSRVFFMIFPK